jgi:hypothetical protein
MSKDLSNVPALGKDNYLEWARKISAYFRLHGLFNIIVEKEQRPTSDTMAQASWDECKMQAASAIEMTLDPENATHIHGIEGQAIEMWKKLESVHNTRTPGGRFNAMDTFFSIKKEESEDLHSLITHVKAGMQNIKALRPVSNTTLSAPSVTVSGGGTTTVALYTLETLDEELIIMALLRALPEDYNSLRSSLFIQSSLNLQIVKSAFLAEDNQCQHATCESASTLHTFSDWKPASSSHQHPLSSRLETTPPSSTPSSTSARFK